MLQNFQVSCFVAGEGRGKEPKLMTTKPVLPSSLMSKSDWCSGYQTHLPTWQMNREEFQSDLRILSAYSTNIPLKVDLVFAVKNTTQAAPREHMKHSGLKGV